MKLITRETDYALRAVLYIAQKKESIVSVAELVGKLKIPGPFLRKLLQRLNQAGILKSRKGKGGGFQISKRLDKLFLLDLIGVFQGPFKINECIFKNHLCPNRDICLLRKKINSIEEHVLLDLKPITIASLLGSKGAYHNGAKKDY